MLPAERLRKAAIRRPLLDHVILHSAAYLTTCAVAAVELLALPLGPRFAWTAALLAVFSATLVMLFRGQHRFGRVRIILLVLAASAIVIGITAVGASTTLGAILLFILCAIVGTQFSVAGIIAWVAGATALFGCRERSMTR
jgi:hypothetical protein